MEKWWKNKTWIFSYSAWVDFCWLSIFTWSPWIKSLWKEKLCCKHFDLAVLYRDIFPGLSGIVEENKQGSHRARNVMPTSFPGLFPFFLIWLKKGQSPGNEGDVARLWSPCGNRRPPQAIFTCTRVTCPRLPVFARPDKYSLHGLGIISWVTFICFTPRGEGEQRRGLMPLGLFLFWLD